MDIQLDMAPCGYFSISDSGIIKTINQTLLTMLGYERNELLGRHIESTMSVTNKLFFHTYFYPYIQLYGHVDEMYFTFRTSDQQDVPVLLNGIRQTRDGESVVDCVVVVMRKRIEHEKDIMNTKTKLQELYQATNDANKELERLHEEYKVKQQALIKVNDQLETMASTDLLTGLKNRRFFQDKMLESLALFRETQCVFSLLVVDIDHFKNINDTYGHPIGDLVLGNLAGLLQSVSRSTDVVARYGGEEFVIILANCDREQAVATAERYRSQVDSADWGEYNITVSIGAATVSQEDTDQSLFQKADKALYASKTGGRNRVTHAAELVRN
ncbi:MULTISPECIES: sensor domain-containing diguanylate cyclase [unclassified Paenibacillus]|uniref:sensor domain-containing diguanylate cyclase n=1 Tax=unclassified Paenibacillus TaxID=185978 RepID=UPI0009A8080C|nr:MULTISPECIES: sensor domain-containing diguanylate cyclase [unclassified Paenibacillus]NTJ18570.1 diguanylate cyclase [Rhizobium rhizogenes]SLK11993.1 PAS domain S-box-containing protein/diguanylate cyclase (GGDEF) domain-containing protein [Paenibacillus sp. RU5A]SOC72476.1 PAS domain S-box-containing protein/diguanylate cyclase (GGDEF) domain-containing protein [Paenibacillus sp. RU26A]SOC74889.1 PAS domain S-box-containing protein/diguanylate cyclase (GGDEF) domain-containing protein [Pae